MEEWLKSQGFKLEKDATNSKLLGLSIHNAVLTLEAKARMSGFILNDSVDFNQLSKQDSGGQPVSARTPRMKNR